MTTLKMRDGFGKTVGGFDCVIRSTLGSGLWCGTVGKCLVVWDEDGLALVVVPLWEIDYTAGLLTMEYMSQDAYDVAEIFELENKTVFGIDYSGKVVGPYTTIGSVPSSYKPVSIEWSESMSFASLNFVDKSDPDKVLHDVSDGDVVIDGTRGRFYQINDDQFVFFIVGSRNRWNSVIVPRKCSKDTIRHMYALASDAPIEFLPDKKEA